MKWLHDVQLWPRPGADRRLLASLRRRRRPRPAPSVLFALFLPVSLLLVLACLSGLRALVAIEMALGRLLFGPYDSERAACALISAWSLMCGLGLLRVVLRLIRYHRLGRLLLRLHVTLTAKGLPPGDNHAKTDETLGVPRRPGFLGRARRILRIDNSDAAVIRRARRALRWRWLSLGSACVFLVYALAGAAVLPAEAGRGGVPTGAGITAVAVAAATGSVLGVGTVVGYEAFLALLVGHASRRTHEIVLRYHDILAGQGALPDDLKEGDMARAGKAEV